MRGATFLSLVTQLRNRLRRASSISVGVDDVDSLKQALNTAYETIYLGHDWPHLRKMFSKPLSAGAYNYDWPTGLNYERIEEAVVFWQGEPHKIERGIGFEHYAEFDTNLDERNDPVQRWDIRFTGTTDQVEVWPIPATSGGILRFLGHQSITTLVNDIDVCKLDDKVVVAFAAASLITGDEKRDALAEAQDLLRIHRGRANQSTTRYRLGAGQTERGPYRPTIRISS